MSDAKPSWYATVAKLGGDADALPWVCAPTALSAGSTSMPRSSCSTCDCIPRCELRRVQLAFVCLTHLGVTEANALELIWDAVDLDPMFGIERILMRVRAYCSEHSIAPDLKAARELIGKLSERAEVLEAALREIHSEQEREAISRIEVR